MQFEVYCDGSTRGNGKENAVGAWAYAVLCADCKKFEYCQAVVNTTNQNKEWFYNSCLKKGGMRKNERPK